MSRNDATAQHFLSCFDVVPSGELPRCNAGLRVIKYQRGDVFAMQGQGGQLERLTVSEASENPHGEVVVRLQVGSDPVDVFWRHAQAMSLEAGVTI